MNAGKAGAEPSSGSQRIQPSRSQSTLPVPSSPVAINNNLNYGEPINQRRSNQVQQQQLSLIDDLSYEPQQQQQIQPIQQVQSGSAKAQQASQFGVTFAPQRSYENQARQVSENNHQSKVSFEPNLNGVKYTKVEYIFSQQIH